jgi:hypothetical protein
VPDDTDDPFSLKNRKKALDDFYKEHGIAADSARAALETEQAAFEKMEDEQAALKQLIPNTSVTDMMLRGIQPPRIDTTSFMEPIDVDGIAESIAESKRADRKAQADLIVGPLRDAMERQHATLTAQHEALGQLSGALEQQTDLMKDQARQLDEERSKRADAERAEATARGRERLKNTLIVVFAFATTVLTAVLVYIALNPPASTSTSSKPRITHTSAPASHESAGHRLAAKG